MIIIDIYDYAKYPNKEDCPTIRIVKSKSLEKTELDKPTHKNTFLDMFGIGNGVELQYG